MEVSPQRRYLLGASLKLYDKSAEKLPASGEMYVRDWSGDEQIIKSAK